MLGARFNEILTLCPLKSTVLPQGEGCWSHFVVGNFLLFMDLFLILTHTHTHKAVLTFAAWPCGAARCRRCL